MPDYLTNLEKSGSYCKELGWLLQLFDGLVQPESSRCGDEGV
jgi:hypothetical protein